MSELPTSNERATFIELLNLAEHFLAERQSESEENALRKRIADALTHAPAHETNAVTDEQAFIAAAVKALRGHRWCGDQYPENGWSDVNTALTLYAKLRRSPKDL